MKEELLPLNCHTQVQSHHKLYVCHDEVWEDSSLPLKQSREIINNNASL